MSRMVARVSLIFVVAVFNNICAPASSSQFLPAAGHGGFSSRVVATGLDSPWEIVWGPDSHIWVTERTGKRVTRVNPVDGSQTTAVSIPGAYQASGQDGVLGMALHPELLTGTGLDFVYVSFVYDADPGPAITRRAKIRRYTYDPGGQIAR